MYPKSFNTSQPQGALVTAYDSQEEEEEDDVTLTAGVTENKLRGSNNALGQLLASMEKVAGDIAYQNIVNGPEERKVFRCITIFALSIDFVKDECKVYKLEMDFSGRRSKLYVGDKALDLPDGVNRLFGALQQRR